MIENNKRGVLLGMATALDFSKLAEGKRSAGKARAASPPLAGVARNSHNSEAGSFRPRFIITGDFVFAPLPD